MAAKPKGNLKILFARVDALGDLMVTAGVDQHPDLKSHHVTWLIQKGSEFILQNSFPKRTFFSIEKNFEFSEFFRLVSWLKKEKFSHFVLIHGPWWLSLASFVAGIAFRGGKRSQWHSFVFLRQSIRQSRKDSLKHENKYNLELVEKSLNLSSSENSIGLRLKTHPDVEGDLLNDLPKIPFVVIHPGMRGSALNWPSNHYLELIEKLGASHAIVITGTAADKTYLEELKEVRKNPNVHWLVGKLTGDQLIATLSRAKAVFVPSTGVAHIAAACETPVFTFYPPLKVQSPTRWRPLGEKVHVFSPEVVCPAKKQCLMQSCQFHPCMQKISVQNVWDNFTSKSREL